MLYVSIDIETSGLDPEKHVILSMGAVIEDTTKKLPFQECPKFNAIILQREIVGSPRAITINKELISLMGEYLEGDAELKQNMKTHLDYNFFEEDEVAKEFYLFLHKNGYYQGIENSGGYVQIKDGTHVPMFNNGTKPIKINVAGKNFGTFDKLFLEKLPWWKKLIIPIQRILDPAILVCDFKKDESLPSLNECKQRLDINGEVTHNALEDAWDVIQVLRKFY